MNYQHAFHAGNFADVHKHVVLTLVLDYLRRKPAPFRVIDSHAGVGRYDLTGPEAARSPEWRDGIARLVAAAPDLRGSAYALLKPYLDIVAAQNLSGALRVYPGSPLIAKARLRPQDRLVACELEPRAAASLKASLRGDPRIKTLTIDGWIAVKANVPPKERRGLMLIDPPYEDAHDFIRLTDALGEAHRKWPTGIYMLWYPIKERAAPDALARRLRRLGVTKVLRSEITLAATRPGAGLAGSGLIVVNPPHTLAGDLQILLPVLIRVFSPDGTQRLDWLAGEAPHSFRRRVAKA
ncbi:MAG TPA: 23S rRNA (adenine(2030)-N(6))-methyltransferase RlmJ [Xanthobacteraceae bacterium]|nr:23S rRNA (adenine(2030)-N(6))-methyltransferase RlmJ [Xanthobacteraceae bacterium]